MSHGPFLQLKIPINKFHPLTFETQYRFILKRKSKLFDFVHHFNINSAFTLRNLMKIQLTLIRRSKKLNLR